MKVNVIELAAMDVWQSSQRVLTYRNRIIKGNDCLNLANYTNANCKSLAKVARNSLKLVKFSRAIDPFGGGPDKVA